MNNSRAKKFSFLSISFIVLAIGFVLSSSVFATPVADPSSSATATVHVSEACSLTSTIVTPHSDSMGNGTYTDSLGSTKFTVKCNDASGFALYAIGYSGDEYGATSMLGDNELSIPTGTDASAGNTTSHWSMKISKDTTSYLPSSLTIENSFNSQHLIPSTYTKIVSFPSSTDGTNGTGTSILATYGVRISGTQAAGTYIGKVKYTLVHPNMVDNSNKPVAPIPSNLLTANYIIYAPNTSDIEGDMSSLGYTEALHAASPKAGRQSASANSTVTLRAPNFKREGYGFAGWSTSFDATTATSPIIYGPNETISTNPQDARGLDVSGGAVLYPVWIAKETGVTMQTFNSTNYSTYTSAPNGTVIALEDERDHDVYAVAKLADGNWWMIENLRLDNTATLTTTNTHNPLHDTNNNNIVTLKTDYANNTIATHLAASNSGTWCTSNSAACYDQTMLNTNNARLSDSSLTASYSANNATSKWYGYGNYYNWYSATAGNGTLGFSTNNNSVTGDLCPAGWHLPKGGDKNNAANSEFWALSLAIVGAEPANTSSQTRPYYTGTPEGTNASNAIRAYPNNFVYSGRWDGAQALSRSSSGLYWSSSAGNSALAYNLLLASSNVYPGTNNVLKYIGYSVRCVRSVPTIDDVEYLQDFDSFNSRELTNVLNSMTTGQAYHIPDNRDNESYTIAKLADGNVWMLDNMKLDISNSSVKANLNSATTNAPDNALASLASNATDVTAIDSYTSPQIITAYKNNTNGTPYGNGSGKVGIYYNYCAVSAGTICDNSSTSDATHDICPAGWRLPTGGSGGEFHNLCLAYDSSCSNGGSSKTASDTTGVQYNLSRAPAGFALGSLGGIMSADSTLVLWSSTYYGFRNNDSYMYTMNLNNDNVSANSSLMGARRYGMSMRCLVNK